MAAISVMAFLVPASLLVSGCGSGTGDGADTAQLQQLQRLVAIRVEKQNQEVAFQTVDQDDSSLASGTTETSQQGANGLRQITYMALYLYGNEYFRLPVETRIVTPPVNQIVSVGTAQPSTGVHGGQSQTADAEYQAEKAAAAARLQAQVQADYEKDTAGAQHVTQCMGRIPVPPGC